MIDAGPVTPIDLLAIATELDDQTQDIFANDGIGEEEAEKEVSRYQRVAQFLRDAAARMA